MTFEKLKFADYDEVLNIALDVYKEEKDTISYLPDADELELDKLF